MAANYGPAAKLVRFLAWVEILLPLAFVVVTIPASLYLLIFGGIILVAPPVALGILGLGIAKGLRARTRAAAAAVWSLVHVAALGALAIHSTTWTVDRGQEYLIAAVRITLWLGAAGHLIVPFVLAYSPTSIDPGLDDRKHGPAYPEVRPRLWPWVVGAALVLAAIALGIPRGAAQ
jgi:hypothetical protein